MPHPRPTSSSSGWRPSITARYFSACPSDSASRRTPCPPGTTSGGFRSALAVSDFRLRAVGIEFGRANGEVEGSHPRPFGCEVAAHFHQRHVFRSPPIIPDGRISQVRFETLAFSRGPFQARRGLNASSCTPLSSLVCPPASSPGQRPATAPVLSSRPPTLA